jgi:hypothetical protein
VGRGRALTAVPLKIGPIASGTHGVEHSGVRWLCEDGHLCKPGEIIAYCNIGLLPNNAISAASQPFAAETADLQVAFAPRIGGRLRISSSSSRGGFMDQLPHAYDWRPDFVIGHIDAGETAASALDGPEDQLSLFGMAGRRMVQLAPVRAGLLTGWHDRARAWSGEADGRQGVLLGLGLCDQMGVMRGDRGAFLELFEAPSGPAHAVYWGGEPLIHCARVLIEQMRRTEAEYQAIAEDMARSFSAGAAAPGPGDWMFMGALLAGLRRSPIGERHDIVTRAGLQPSGPADALLLSVNAEPATLFRHKRLGYAVHCQAVRLHEAGPHVMNWLRTHFDFVGQALDDILRDYVELIDLCRGAQPAGGQPAVLIMNTMSSSGLEDIQMYAPFDRPLGDTLAHVRAKELNLMLHDLAAVREISIVDSDAIAADLGGWAHIVDGIHQSGPMQAEVRAEILHILNDRRATGSVRRPTGPGLPPDPAVKLTSGLAS